MNNTFMNDLIDNICDAGYSFDDNNYIPKTLVQFNKHHSIDSYVKVVMSKVTNNIWTLSGAIVYPNDYPDQRVTTRVAPYEFPIDELGMFFQLMCILEEEIKNGANSNS